MNPNEPGPIATSELVRALSLAGWADRSERVRLEVNGPDRVRFLHNLTTNDIKRLAVGRGCEAFVTSPQGKTLGYVTVLALEDRLLLRTDPGGLEHILPHFQKYGLFDEVAWEDISDRTCEFHLIGPEAPPLLEGLGAELPEPSDLRLRQTSIVGLEVLLIRESPFGVPGLTLIGDATLRAELTARFRDAAQMVALDPATCDALRIEAGTPVFGRDVTADNLPQEVGRDAQAISFVKGCYLGQETVARIDALGHVNKVLKGLLIESGAVPPPGAPLEVEGKVVGRITSSAFSPRLGQPIA
ncbi:MAG: folate-binding protein, partial [Isosphaeraceae bacterium]|nr:folate-binding protein [Isosphaeraceae bacterium]